MIREQKVYEIGTLVSQKLNEFGTAIIWLEEQRQWQNGIIIERFRMKGRYPIEYRYVIRWDGGETLEVSPKVLKGFVKSGRFQILSES
jgi:hypothetical protein